MWNVIARFSTPQNYLGWKWNIGFYLNKIKLPSYDLIIYREKFMKYKNRLHGKIGTFEMPKESIHEIDDKEDLILVKKIIANTKL